MKKVTLTTGLLVLSTSAFTAINNPDFINAQKGEIKTHKENKNSIVNGWKVAIGASNLKMNIKSDDNEKLKDDMDSKAQVTIGYSNIKVNKVGYITELSFLNTLPESQKDQELQLAKDNIRLTVNATYGFTDKLYGFGGLNVSRYTDKTYITSDSATVVTSKLENEYGTGFQIGAGYQISKQFSVELSYLEMNSKVRASAQVSGLYESAFDGYDMDTEFDLQTKGTQLNLIGSF
jgi:opacity protein-like surface antigen